MVKVDVYTMPAQSGRLDRVFRNRYETKSGGHFYKYRIQMSRKLQDETWDNAYMTVEFTKKINVPDADSFDIDISKGFLSFDKGADNKIFWKFVVMECEFFESGYTKETSTRPAEPGPVDQVFMGTDDEIPF